MLSKIFLFVLNLLRANNQMLISIGLKVCIKYIRKALRKTAKKTNNDTVRYLTEKCFPFIFDLVSKNFDDNGMFEIFSKINNEKGDLENISTEVIMKEGNVSQLIIGAVIDNVELKSNYDLKTKEISLDSTHK